MQNSNLYLILASAEIEGDGFWLIDTTYNESPSKEKKYILECHRKELIGEESAEKILYAINLNVSNLYNDLKKDGFIIEAPPKGISFNLPLHILENIFDFWLEIYKDQFAWETCLGLLKIKTRLPLNNLISSGVLTGKAKKWAPKIEYLHIYRPSSFSPNDKSEPMWN